jgi:ABC-type transport system involved in multi-copper enzyme maturation permease subunit
MLKTLIIKEVTTTIFDLRFVVATLLCMVLIPLGMYVSRKDYEGRLARYRREHAQYRQRHEKGISGNVLEVKAQGFRPPSPLSIFASGVDSFMPDRVVTSYEGLYSTAKESRAGNTHSLLFGKADFVFSVTFILSLAALVLSFNAISGERETGTLRLMIANSVPRGHILLGKLVGIYVALLIPFFLSLVIALLVLETSPDVSIAAPEIGPPLLVILGITGLFLFGMVTLGVCISTFTRTSADSIVLSFLVWATLALGIPKVSPMLADVLYPIERPDVFNLKKRLLAEDIDRELIAETTKLRERVYTRHNLPMNMASSAPEFQKADAELKLEFQPLLEQYRKRSAEALQRMEQDYQRRIHVRSLLAVNLSRLSPVCSYTYVVTTLSGTGTGEPDNFLRNAQQYQDTVKSNIYDKVAVMRIGWGASYSYADGYDHRSISLPDMAYSYPTLTSALAEIWPDILLLGLFSTLFWVLAFARLNKYDVR